MVTYGERGQENGGTPSDPRGELASKEVPKMESLTKDIFYKVRRAAASWGKRRKRNGPGRGKDRESLMSRNGKQMTITSAEVQGYACL